jgi:hypothetical protein
MRLKMVSQLKDEWKEYMMIIEAYLDLREKATPVPYASILNHISYNNPDEFPKSKELTKRKQKWHQAFSNGLINRQKIVLIY